MNQNPKQPEPLPSFVVEASAVSEMGRWYPTTALKVDGILKEGDVWRQVSFDSRELAVEFAGIVGQMQVASMNKYVLKWLEKTAGELAEKL